MILKSVNSQEVNYKNKLKKKKIHRNINMLSKNDCPKGELLF